MPPKKKYSEDQYVSVAADYNGMFTCPACSVVFTSYKPLYNHYYNYSVRSKDISHPGLLHEDKRRCQHSGVTPTLSPVVDAVVDLSSSAHTDTQEAARFETIRKVSSYSDHKQTVPSQDQEESTAALRSSEASPSACPIPLHQLPKQCRSSVLVNGYLQNKVSLQKLQAAAAMEACCSGTEAYLDAPTIRSIRGKALLELHPDKNSSLDSADCNEVFNKFQERIDKLLYTTLDNSAYFWEHLVQESIAAVAYLSFVAGWQAGQGCTDQIQERAPQNNDIAHV